MNIHNGMAYENNYARAAAYFLSTMAPEPAQEGRRAAYALIKKLYEAVFDDAAALGYKPVADVSFAPWEGQKGREQDVKAIRGAIDKVEGLAKALFDMAQAAEITAEGLLLPQGTPAPQRTFAKALATAGVAVERGDRVRVLMPSACALALRELAAISRASTAPITDSPKEDKAHLLFSRGVFEPSENWAAQAFDRLLDADGQLIWLCGELEKRGYKRVDCRDGKRITLDYIKPHGKQSQPLKMAWGERSHTGIEVSYEELRLAPCYMWMRMPRFKDVLESEKALPEGVRAFIACHTKRCDGCKYCIQTDKTGARPVAAISFAGKRLCPYYPGFSMNWRQLTPETARDILAALDAVDALLDK